MAELKRDIYSELLKWKERDSGKAVSYTHLIC